MHGEFESIFNKHKKLVLEHVLSLNEGPQNTPTEQDTGISAERSKRTKNFKTQMELLPSDGQQDMVDRFIEWKKTGVLRNSERVNRSAEFIRVAIRGTRYRAIAKEVKDAQGKSYLIWVWAGTHQAYNNIVDKLRDRFSGIMLREDDSEQMEDLFNPDGSLNL